MLYLQKKCAFQKIALFAQKQDNRNYENIVYF